MMRKNLPNQLTILRLVLAGVFFVVINQYRFPSGPSWALWTGMVLFIIGAVTDALDGYFARRWHVESRFGRIMDPFCDKVLVLGAFIYLAGPRFVDPVAVANGDFFTMISGVYPWMVAVMLSRELLVTGIRGELERDGVKFPSKLSGKLKMVLQSVGVPIILYVVWLNESGQEVTWSIWLRDGLVYSIVVVTVISGVPYVTGAIAAAKKALREDR